MPAAWETFYLVLGTCAGALVGVMFIVATLGAEIEAAAVNRGTVVYQSPIVFHLSVILAVSALALVPEHLVGLVGALFALSGLAGMAYSALTFRRTLEQYDFYTATTADRLFYGVLPFLFYVALLLGGLAVFWWPEPAAEIAGAATLLLLLISIRNAWDVATFSVRVARTQKAKGSAQK